MHYIKSLCALAVICAFNAVPALADDASLAGTDNTSSGSGNGYAGIFLGSRTQDTDWTTTDLRNRSGSPFPALSDPHASVSSRDNDLGVLAGYNWNLGEAWVTGVEADFQLMENTTRMDSIPGMGRISFPTGAIMEVTAEDSFSLRGRGGYRATPGLLVYGTAGLAALDVGITSPCVGFCDDASRTSFTDEKTMSGYTIGVGVEYATGTSLFRAEYRASDFGDSGFTVIPAGHSIYSANAVLNVKTGILQIGLVSGF
jgi:outer membrane immunogenic protein